MLGLALGYEKPTSQVSRFGILDYREGYQILKPWYPCGDFKKNQISDPVQNLRTRSNLRNNKRHG
jgi:hypothetical protein